MKKYWLIACGKVDAMSLRERAMLFAIAALSLVFALNSVLFEPLQEKQKNIAAKMLQQEQETRAVQASIQALLQSRHQEEHSPLRARIAELKAQVEAGDRFLKDRRERLVEPEKMAELMEQVLRSNEKLKLVELKTLPLSLLVEPKSDVKAVQQIYKHGVQITLRGSYLELLNYLIALEKLPTRVFWGDVSLSVAKHPDAVLTLTVYTLSLNKTWLTV